MSIIKYTVPGIYGIYGPRNLWGIALRVGDNTGIFYALYCGGIIQLAKMSALHL